jgi:phage FluMu gp28-like protein
MKDKYFLPYQRKWIADLAGLKIIEKSRQIGMSYATAYSAVKRAAAKGARLDVWVSSRDDTQAKLFLEDCKAWAEVLQVAATDLGEVLFDKANGFSAFVLRFANGLCIYSLSSNPNALAGKRGHVILDEFALHKDQRLLYRIAKPVTQWGGQLEIISTHRGVTSVFNQILVDVREHGNPMGWSHHKVTLQDAVEQGLVEKINEKKLSVVSGQLSVGESREGFLARTRRECLDEEQWLQEYCCVPADESTAFITYEMIRGCEQAGCLKDFNYLLDCKNPLYLGLDVGRKKDLTVIDVGEKVGDVMVDRLRIELANKKFSEQEYELYRLLALPQMKRACIDATGLGMQLAERATERFGWKVEGVTFTGPVKEELAYPLRAAFEDRKLRIDRSDALTADLRGIKKEVTASGNIRFVGESDDSHCDRFWAKALRQHAAANKVSMGAMVGE